jgi:hypothetical protein
MLKINSCNAKYIHVVVIYTKEKKRERDIGGVVFLKRIEGKKDKK